MNSFQFASYYTSKQDLWNHEYRRHKYAQFQSFSCVIIFRNTTTKDCTALEVIAKPTNHGERSVEDAMLKQINIKQLQKGNKWIRAVKLF